MFVDPRILQQTNVGPPKRPALPVTTFSKIIASQDDMDARNAALGACADTIGDKAAAARAIADAYANDSDANDDGYGDGLSILYSTPRADDVAGVPANDTIDAETLAYICKQAVDDDGRTSIIEKLAAYVNDRVGASVAVEPHYDDYDALAKGLEAMFDGQPEGTISAPDLARIIALGKEDDDESSKMLSAVLSYTEKTPEVADVIAAGFGVDETRADQLNEFYQTCTFYIEPERLCRYLTKCDDDGERMSMLKTLKGQLEDVDAALPIIREAFDDDDIKAELPDVLHDKVFVGRDSRLRLNGLSISIGDDGDVFVYGAPKTSSWRDRLTSAWDKTEPLFTSKIGLATLALTTVVVAGVLPESWFANLAGTSEFGAKAFFGQTGTAALLAGAALAACTATYGALTPRRRITTATDD